MEASEGPGRREERKSAKKKIQLASKPVVWTGTLISEAKYVIIKRSEHFPELEPKGKRVSCDYLSQNLIQSLLMTFSF